MLLQLEPSSTTMTTHKYRYTNQSIGITYNIDHKRLETIGIGATEKERLSL